MVGKILTTAHGTVVASIVRTSGVTLTGVGLGAVFSCDGQAAPHVESCLMAHGRTRHRAPLSLYCMYNVGTVGGLGGPTYQDNSQDPSLRVPYGTRTQELNEETKSMLNARETPNNVSQFTYSLTRCGAIFQTLLINERRAGTCETISENNLRIASYTMPMGYTVRVRVARARTLHAVGGGLGLKSSTLSDVGGLKRSVRHVLQPTVVQLPWPSLTQPRRRRSPYLP